MGLTTEDRYLPLLTSTMLKVLQLAKEKATDSQRQTTRLRTYLRLQSTELSNLYTNNPYLVCRQ